MQNVIRYKLKDHFVDKLCNLIDKEYLSKGKDLGRTAFIFEGKRPSLFIKKKISVIEGKSFVPPVFFSIDEFMKYLFRKQAEFKALSNMDAWHMIFSLAGELAPEILEGRGKFSEFMPWAREIAAFIDILDFENIPSEKLENIEASASIGYDIPKSINKILGKIILLRDKYHDEQIGSNTFSTGYIYKLLAERIDKIDMPEFDHIYFCGFYYMQNTVIEITRALEGKNQATVVLQGDEEDDRVLERITSSTNKSAPKKTFSTGNIKLHAAFDTHSQVCTVREILKDRDPADTVVVLPDPSAMLPLVTEIGAESGDFNISLGYPMERSALFSLVKLIFRAQKTKKDDKYYVKDYIYILSHPLLKNLNLKGDARVNRVLVHKIEEAFLDLEGSKIKGSIFVRLSDVEEEEKILDAAYETLMDMGIIVDKEMLAGTLKDIHEYFFRRWEEVEDFVSFSGILGNFLDLVTAKSVLSKYPLNLKVAKRLYDINDELRGASFKEETFESEDIFRIFSDLISSEMIAFSGSPLKGLQMLGLLETRSLNFKNVIIMDANDMKLPRLRKYHPLIPHEITRSLGVDLLKKEEKIQHYLFRRLLAYADNIDMIYEEATGKERSRFIEGIEWDMQREKGSFHALDVTRYAFNVNIPITGEVINKPGEIAVFLSEEFRYSASSINTYLKCPLQFYYNYVLCIKEKEAIAEDVEGKEIGTFIHELLEYAFKEVIGKKPDISEDFRKGFFAEYDKRFKYTFKRKMRTDSFLLDRVMRYRLERFLSFESNRQVKEVIYLEEDFEEKLELSGDTFAFKYIVDRVDRLEDDSILILDYKTGLDAKKPAGTDKLENMNLDREDIHKYIRSFQLPLYYYYEKRKYGDSVVDAALYHLRNPALDNFITSKTDIDRTMEICMKALDYIMHEIIDPDVPFARATEDPDSCRFCPFTSLCR